MVTSPWIRASVTLGLSATAAVGFVSIRPDCMVVEQVHFEGAHHAGPGALRHLADLRNGTTIWSVDLEALSRGVERHPWVRSARAFRSWPTDVVVVVEEHEPAAILHYDAMYYVNQEGVPFLRGDLPDLDHPHLTGLDPKLERQHPGLPGLVVRDALELISGLEQAGLASRDTISEVAFSDTRGFTVHTGSSRILFGLDGLDTQIERLEALVDRGAVDLEAPTWVDLGPANVAIVRPLQSQLGGA